MSATDRATSAQASYLISLWAENRALLGEPAKTEDLATVMGCFSKSEASQEIDNYLRANRLIRQEQADLALGQSEGPGGYGGRLMEGGY